MDLGMFDEESLEKGAALLTSFVDGESKNINPLAEIPEPEMRLYGVEENYFSSLEEARGYCQKSGVNLAHIYVLDYIREVAGCKDVIRKTSKDGKSRMYTAVDEDGYAIYNEERSIYRNEFIWEYVHGRSVREWYAAFREREIVFEQDIYAEIDKRNQHILRYCKKHNLFNMGEGKK